MQNLNVSKKTAKARTTANKKKVSTRVGDMTVDELKSLIRDTVVESLSEFSDPDYDPDDGLTFKPEVAEYLRKYLKERPRGTPMDEVFAEMGIGDE